MTRKSSKNSVEYRLLHPVDRKEETRRSNIQEWLHSIGITDVRVEYTTRDGMADIYLPGKRVIIEVKENGKADDPHSIDTGSKHEESAFGQLARYLEAERKNEQRYLDDGENTDQPWIGIITDSQVWHIWEWNYTPKEILDWQHTRLNKENIDLLARFILGRRQVGKEWAPEDPTSLFRNSLEMLTKLYEQMGSVRYVITQKELWYRQLEISGNQPDEKHRDELFILHTLLIAVSTKISVRYGNEGDRYGFASWVKGTEWLDNLGDIINRHNWKQQTGDVLRTLYMGLVDKSHRHIYGEYYTPDWLAEKLCMEVIDDNYIERWVNGEGVDGVMDPACGSGTFLYHAIHRIIDSKPVQEATMDDQDLTDMLVKMIHGIDIHPVAVSMAKANILRALPVKPSKPLQIYQGDSLQINLGESQQRVDEGVRAFSITSRKDVEIRFPLEFIVCNDFDRRILWLTDAAVAQRQFPPRIDAGMSEESKDMLKQTFDTLYRVCDEEGNGAWAWYVINQVGVYKLRNSAARIVTNPPWVKMATIQNIKRKNRLEKLAKDLKLWVGGANAPVFNIASVFVRQCTKLYGGNEIKSGWVLPDSALYGNNWKKYVEMVDPPIRWNLGNLPFPKHSKACVNIFGFERQSTKRLILKNGNTVSQHENWSQVESKTRFEEEVEHIFRPSEWLKGGVHITIPGVTLVPYALTKLDSYKIENDRIKGRTGLSSKKPWSGCGGFNVDVPQSWLHNVIFSQNLLPFCIFGHADIILPIDKRGVFLKDRNTVQWWKDVSDIYKNKRGSGKSTPKTLELQISHRDKLAKQFPLKSNIVIYNISGDRIRAARLEQDKIVNYKLFKIQTASIQESLFLTAILNADCLQERFRETKTSSLNFGNELWYKVPIPRYDKYDKNHVLLSKLALEAEGISGRVQNKTNKSIYTALREVGMAARIDVVVEHIMKAAEKDTVSN